MLEEAWVSVRNAFSGNAGGAQGAAAETVNDAKSSARGVADDPKGSVANMTASSTPQSTKGASGQGGSAALADEKSQPLPPSSSARREEDGPAPRQSIGVSAIDTSSKAVEQPGLQKSIASASSAASAALMKRLADKLSEVITRFGEGRRKNEASLLTGVELDTTFENAKLVDASVGNTAPDGSTPQMFVSVNPVEALGVSPAKTRSILDELRALAGGGPSDIFSAALTMALESVQLGGDEEGLEEGEDAIAPPKYPYFDPVTALILAGYAFQAYLEPPRGSYWETRSVRVPGSELSDRNEQTITNRVAFPSTEAIAREARGVFMVHVKNVEPKNGLKPFDESFCVTALLNGGALHSTTLKGGSSYFSLLNSKNESVAAPDVPKAEQETLVLSVYESEDAFENGDTSIGTATLMLSTLVEDARGVPGGSRRDPEILTFDAVTEEAAIDNFFELDLLPEGMLLPFGTMTSGENTRGTFADQVAGSSLSVQVSYIPFDMPRGGDEVGDDPLFELDELVKNEEEEEPIEVQEYDALTISEIMAKGGMPLEWKKLAKELTAMVKEIEDSSLSRPDQSLHENLPKTMFISSPETDSEVWIWHETESKQVVVSFRGTEQTKWKDFVTDSLVFLQTWSPGEPIVLDIVAGRTMGLDLWDVVLRGSKKGQDDDVSAMPCVHWGFLRAYLSLRDSVDGALEKLTNGFEDGYQYFFTGHSLGGALATLASCDLQARRGGERACMDICMINFGSPRVGNRSFAVEFNRLIPNAFRVVNGADLVARMPQTPSRLRGGFRHAGRTCLVDEEGSVWVQGESYEGADHSSFPVQRVGTLKALLDREREMWALLISGQSLGHHLEDSYFTSLRTAVRKLLSR